MRTIKKYTSKKPGKKTVTATNKMIVRGYPRGLASQELKWVDTDLLLQATGNYGYTDMVAKPHLIGGVALGTSQSQRIGQEITFKSIHVNYAFWRGTDTFQFGTNPIGRCLIIVDKQPNGVTFSQTDLFENGVPNVGQEFKVAQSHYNLSNRKRFQILYDKSHDLNIDSGYEHKTVKLKCNIKVNFNKGVTNDISDIMNNAVYIVMIANINPALPDTRKIFKTFNSRLRYTD